MKEVSTGRIIKGIGGFYYVDIGKDIITCRARGKLRKLGETPYVGDIVDIDIQNDSTGYVLNIHERKNVLIRPPISNIDTIVIVASKAPPVTDSYFIDKISVMAVFKNIEVCIVINKCDEDNGDELYDVYKNSGIKIFRVSAKNGDGIDEFKEYLTGKLTAFTGNSGVGKSTLINSIMPQAGLETGEINAKIGRGRHTTRQVEILKLSDGTWIADTPGFSVFDIAAKDEITTDTLQDFFPEFKEYKDSCQFVGCSHVKDYGCAVVDAVNCGKIQQSRYESYKRMFEELESIPKYK
ncbi:MAG: ribosome small subunit-dependent GTPase A [Oscillospiraceae bacterium]|nr:ribosome small subunit-dependent GTPase A [Oscillospiraceae bacterium]